MLLAGLLLLGCGTAPTDPHSELTGGQKQTATPPATVATPPADPSDSPLSDDLRTHVWDVEHFGFVLEATVFPKLKSGLNRADFTPWQSLLTNGATASVPAEPLDALQPLAGGTGQFGQVIYDDSRRTTAAGGEFIQWLKAIRDPFLECSSSLGLVRLIPDQTDLQGAWTSVWRLRLAGRDRNGPAETEVEFRLRLTRLQDDIADHSDWVSAVEVLRLSRLQARREWFQEVTDNSGLLSDTRYDNWSQEQFVPNTGGVYVTDYDQDGWLDVFVDDFSDGNRLYRGLGNGQFEDVTEAAGIAQAEQPRGWTLSCWADLDNDGDDDLIVEDRLYENTGDGRFRDVTELSNLPLTPAAGYAVGDYDADGLPDLYVCHTSAYRIGQAERSKVRWIDDGLGIDNVLLRNVGDWQFQDVTADMQAGGAGSSCFAAVWLHANDDHRPDLFAINEFGVNSLLLSQPEGPYVSTDVDPVFGGFSMGVAAGDYNNDGRTDLYVANMYSKAGNRILANIDRSRYPAELYRKIEEGTRGSKLYRSTQGARFDTMSADDMFAYVGWAYGPTFADFDNDGWLDLYATAGFKSEERGRPDG